MPEISSTMYPIVGAAAIAILLLLVVVARRRRAGRGHSDADHEHGEHAAGDESLGVRLIEDDPDALGPDAAPSEGDGRVAEGVDTSDASFLKVAGSPSPVAARSLVAWGPNEGGHEHRTAETDPQTGSVEDRPVATESETPAPAVRPAGLSEPEAEAGHEPGQPSVEPTSAGLPPRDDAMLPPSAAAGGPEEDSAAPEGQPFERDGSWWFRRDGELLVYDDATSEWKAAPEDGTGAPDTGSPVTAANVDKAARGQALQGAATATLERGGPLRPRSEGATSWKCRTCGATNGSAAAGCRMCFSARS